MHRLGLNLCLQKRRGKKMSSLFIAVLILAFIHIIFDHKARTTKKILGIVLTYFLAINVGLADRQPLSI